MYVSMLHTRMSQPVSPPPAAGVLLGWLRVPDQSHPNARSGTDDHWTVLSSHLHRLLHCECLGWRL